MPKTVPFSKRNHSGAEVVDGMRAFSWYSTMSCRSHQTLGTECLVTGVHVGSQHVSAEHKCKRMVAQCAAGACDDLRDAAYGRIGGVPASVTVIVGSTSHGTHFIVQG